MSEKRKWAIIFGAAGAAAVGFGVLIYFEFGKIETLRKYQYYDTQVESKPHKCCILFSAIQ